MSGIYGNRSAEEIRELEQQATAALAAEILEGAWIVTTHHEHCAECNAQIDNAVAHAKVTGSVGATYNYGEHGAKVERETYAQRRAAIA